MKKFLIKLAINFLSDNGYISRNIVADYANMLDSYRNGYNHHKNHIFYNKDANDSIYSVVPIYKHISAIHNKAHEINQSEEPVSKKDMNDFIFKVESE
jgi:hypothetical protein